MKSIGISPEFVQNVAMPNIIVRPGWFLPEKYATPESVYRNRRSFLRELGFSGAGLLLTAGAGLGQEARKAYPYARSAEFNPAAAKLSDEEYVTSYNNFYEFSTTKTRVKKLTGKFVTAPWEVEIGGLV